MSFVLKNPLLRAAQTVNKLCSTSSYVVDVDWLLLGDAGDKDKMQKRWAGSAVVLKNGALGIIPVTEPVKYSDEEEAWRIRVHEDGKFTRRVFWRDAEWVKQNVADVYLGVLTLPDGEGAQARVRRADGSEMVISVVGRDDADTNLAWKAGSARGSEDQELGSVLQSTTLRSWMARPRGDLSVKWLLLDGGEQAVDQVQDAVSALGELGVMVDEAAGAVDIVEIAGVLATVARSRLPKGELARARDDDLAAAYADALSETKARQGARSTVGKTVAAELLGGFVELDQTAGAVGALTGAVAEWRRGAHGAVSEPAA